MKWELSDGAHKLFTGNLESVIVMVHGYYLAQVDVDNHYYGQAMVFKRLERAQRFVEQFHRQRMNQRETEK